MAGREILKRGFHYVVGIGDDINIWEDPWLPLPHHFEPFSLPMEGTEGWMISHHIDETSHVWIEDLTHELFTEEEEALILCMPLSFRCPKDKLIWHFGKFGNYCVHSGYHVARRWVMDGVSAASSSSGSRGLSESLWKRVWHARVPPKVRNMCWRLLRNIVPTREIL